MKTEFSIRGRETAMSCPRRAACMEIPGGNAKWRNLSKVFHNCVDRLTLEPSDSDVIDAIATEFGAMKDDLDLLVSEERAQKNKMYQILKRYYAWEDDWVTKNILEKNFSAVVDFNGEEVSVKADRLIDRGDYYEVVAYAYKKPDLKARGRKFLTNPDKSIRLLLLYRAGMKKLDELRYLHGEDKYPVKEVYASVYYMRSEHDKAENIVKIFDEKSDQVIRRTFTADMASEIEVAYSKVKVDVKETACNPTDCNNCPYNDLCHLEFVPKKKISLPAPAPAPINEIHLTDPQKKFVVFDNGQCRVNAVAGSGKTASIVLRIINLLEEGVPPKAILAITFTDKAAHEMVERLTQYIKGSALENLHLDISEMHVMTFNAWGQMFLEKYFDQLGFTEAPTVIEDVQRKDILIELAEKHQHLPMNYAEPFLDSVHACGVITELGKVIDMMKSAHVETVHDVQMLPRLNSRLQQKASELLDIYVEYNEMLLAQNLIDYEDQLRLVLQLGNSGYFKDLPYQHVIVDEFQDSNKNQIELICQIMAEDPDATSLAVVGDEMQSIYGFRDATPDNLVNFKKYFPDMVDIFLDQNFRSQGPIITLANNIIKHEARIKTAIQAQKNSSNVSPVLLVKDDIKDEVAFYVNQIKALMASGIAPAGIAILGKTRSELRYYEKALNEAGIPTIMKVPEIMSESPYVKAILAFAKWLDDPTQMISFALYAKMMGEDPFDMKKLTKSAEAVRESFINAASDEDRRGLFYTYLSKANDDYVGETFLNGLQEKSHLHTFTDLVKYCVKYDRYGINEQFSTAKEEADAVNLITIHSAKGLEFDNVFLSLKKFKETDEEKRLMYVAVTRAKERLFITYPHKQGLVRLLRDDT